MLHYYVYICLNKFSGEKLPISQRIFTKLRTLTAE